MTTIRQIAEKLGVNVSTVSRSLNDSPTIPESTKERVRQMADQLGYRKDVRAASMRAGKSLLIGVVVGDIVNPFFAQLADRIERQTRAKGYQIMLGNGGEEPHAQTDVVATMLSQNIDGLLLTPAGKPTSKLLSYIQEVPTVAVDRKIVGAEIDSVGCDFSQAVAQLAAHFAGNGYKSVAVLSGPESTSTGDLRQKMLRAALADAGIIEVQAYSTPFQEAGGDAAIKQVLAKKAPDALVCASGVITLGAMLALKANGIRPGVDIGIATFDRLNWLEAMTPPVTMIDTDITEMADLAVTLLLERIAGKSGKPVEKNTTAKLLVRDSTPKLAK